MQHQAVQSVNCHQQVSVQLLQTALQKKIQPHPTMKSLTSITSDRQLRPHVPISYNETVLKHLHGKLQIRTLNNVSIPLPIDSSSEDTDTEDTDEENKHYIWIFNFIHYRTNCPL